MAAKVIPKDAKAPVYLLRSAVLSSVRPKSAPPIGEFVQPLRIATQKPISEAPFHRQHLFDECFLKSQGFTGVGRIWAAGKPGGSGSNKVFDDAGDDFDDDIVGDDFVSDDDDFYDDDDDDYNAHDK